MSKSTSRWRQFHTDELRTFYQRLQISAEELEGPDGPLHLRIKLLCQIRGELELRGVPHSEMAA